MEALILSLHLLPLGAEESERGDASKGDGTGTVGKILVHRVSGLARCESLGKCNLLGALLRLFGSNNWLSGFLGGLLLHEPGILALSHPFIDGVIHVLNNLGLRGVELFKTLLELLVPVIGRFSDVIGNLR